MNVNKQLIAIKDRIDKEVKILDLFKVKFSSEQQSLQENML